MPHRLVLKPDPLGLPRNPLAVFLLCLCFLSGLMMLLGITSARAVDQVLPAYVGFTWGGMLVFGSGNTLIGMYWPGLVSTGLLLKRVGMFTMTMAAGLYGVVILVAAGVGGTLSAGIVFGFGVACAVQFKRLNDRVHAIIQVTQERRAADG